MSLLLVSVLASALGAAPPSTDPRLSILDAMSEELQRNRTRLKLGENAPPYFISYSVKDLTQTYVAARYGALFDDWTNRDRRVFADVRVGSHELDNSINEELDFNFSLKGTSYTTRKEAPLDDDLTALRTRAVAHHRREVQGRPLQPPERRRRARRSTWCAGSEEAALVQPRAAEHLRRPGDGLHLRPGALDGAGAQGVRAVQPGGENLRHRRRVTADKEVRYFVNSEGSRIVTEQTFYGVHLFAVTRADDGQLLDDSPRDYYGAFASRSCRATSGS